MDKLTQLLQLMICSILCLVSTILTALFALSFGSSDTASVDLIDRITPFTLIAIGISIDVSKYIFWGVKEKDTRKRYALLAVILMSFSLVASIAFFISREESKLTRFRKRTIEYELYLIKLENIDNRIQQKRELVKKRLNSKFHQQWDKGDSLNDEIVTIIDEKMRLILTEPTVGISDAKKQVVSTAFFVSISSILSVDPNYIRNVFYAVLAILIEICAFGLITLCRKESKVIVVSRPMAELKPEPKSKPKPKQKPKPISETKPEIKRETKPEIKRETKPEVKRETKPKRGVKAAFENDKNRLIFDIKSGKVPPAFNKLKNLDYKLSHMQIREVLSDLKKAGILKTGSRNSLELVTTSLSVIGK